ncbi:MAG: homoserine dehydrogenase [Deltaproteobacteria bacterium]|nr:homoserine dehydrogenase [Deltaproteobacteria bacterium]
MDKIKVGLIGFGTVGTGVVRVLRENSSVIKDKLGCEVVLKRIADRDIIRKRETDVPGDILTTDVDSIINDPEIAIVIELIGGLEAAGDIIVKALKKGKHVVTANKALLSTRGKELFSLAGKEGCDVGFEASVGGGIPIIKALREGLAANRVESIYGIINGTANYILSKMTNEGGKFETVLKEAQKKGYAEADPTYDVEGMDTAHKLAILINLAYGTYISLESIYTEGITRITELDVRFAREFGYRIKLLAIAKREGRGTHPEVVSGEGKSIEARVHPTMIPLSHPLSSVEGVYNAIHINGNASGPVMFYGRGAGMMPTASAVVADIIDISRNILKGKGPRTTPLAYTEESLKDIKVKKIDDLEVPYYIRFSAKDLPGVLSKISGVLGSHNISISSVIQKGRQRGGTVPLVIITHNSLEREFRKSIEEIETLSVIAGKTMYIRIEENSGGADQ